MKVDYRDERGIKRRALVPYDGVDPSEGVPLSLPIEQVYPDMPVAFIVRLTDALFERGLIEPADFFRAGAPELVRSAILDVAKHDALTIISLAKTLL